MPIQDMTNNTCQSLGKCFAKNTLIKMNDGSIKKIQDIVTDDQVMGKDGQPRTVSALIVGREEMVTIVPDDGYDPFTVNVSHNLVLNNGEYISVQAYNMKKMKTPMMRVKLEYDQISSLTEAYYAGQDRIFSFLLKTHSSVRLSILAGLIDSCAFETFDDRIHLYLNAGLKDKTLELMRSLGFNAIYENNYIRLMGDFASIPFKKHIELQSIRTRKNWNIFTFQIRPSDESQYFGFTLKDDNKEFLLADYTVVKNCN